jgi:hypothetical protein
MKVKSRAIFRPLDKLLAVGVLEKKPPLTLSHQRCFVLWLFFNMINYDKLYQQNLIIRKMWRVASKVKKIMETVMFFQK